MIREEDVSNLKIILEEAVSNLKMILEEVTETDEAICYVTSEDAEDLILAIEALERDIPKTPSYVGTGYWYGEFIYDSWICPNCGIDCEADFDGKYCPECGQAIDFGLESNND